MRKNRMLMMLVACAGLYSCSDDGEGMQEAGRISFYGEKFSLVQGALYHDNNHSVIKVEDYVFEDRYQDNGGEQTDRVEGFTATVKKEQTGNFLVGLYESGFTLSDLTQDARGAGACICLRFASPDTGRLVAGKYTYSRNREAFTFQGYSNAYYNPSSTSALPEPNELTEGEVEVSQTGEEWKIAFRCKTSFGGSIEGSYTGKLKDFDIRKNIGTVNYYEDIRLEALFDRVDYTDIEGVAQSEPDYVRGNAFLQSSTQQVYSGKVYSSLAESAKRSIDLALVYDAGEGAVRFESPIRMRALLWHNTYRDGEGFRYNFDLPCHTKYMPAPADFTDADFEALQQAEDFVFDFAEAEASIPVGSTLPRFVFVQTGNGLQGVLRVREMTPAGTETINDVVYPLNPSVTMDMKFPRNYSEQKLR